MDCDVIEPMLSAYVDREVGLQESLEIERHMRVCAECREQHARLQMLRKGIKQEVPYFHAPADLARRIKAALPAPVVPVAPRRARTWRWVNVGAIAASVIAVAWSVGLYLTLPSLNEQIADEAVSGHVRALLSGHTIDVSSSDTHTVKPWFTGKLDFSPPVYDLTTEGFPLVGGRLDYLSRRPAAALVYRHRQHIISLYVLPAVGERDRWATAMSLQGFNIVHWRHAEMDFWAVSDVNADQLVKLKETLLAQ